MGAINKSSIRMMKKSILLILLVLHLPVAWSFADEDRDWGVPPQRDIRQAPYSAPTPIEIPGARRISTGNLHDMLIMAPPPVLIDVASGEGHISLRGAKWLPGVGRGNHFFDPIQAQLSEYLEKLTLGDKSRPLVFFCVNAQCWLSYNASLRATALGYIRVFWYRGGIEAWREAGLPLANVSLSSTTNSSVAGEGR